MIGTNSIKCAKIVQRGINAILLVSCPDTIYAGRMTKAIAIIVAAGSGSRVGLGVPKQFRSLLGRPVVIHSADVFRKHAAIRQTVIVMPEDMDSDFSQRYGICDLCVPGGKTRAESVRLGLDAIQCSPETPILIHDAARPGLTEAIIFRLLEALKTADAAAPALSLNDAIKRKSGSRLETLDRDQLRRVQTPQIFHYRDIKAALSHTGYPFVDDLEAIEAQGKTVTLISGDQRLQKITYEEDFEIMAQLLGERAVKAPRMGTGYDVHQFGKGDFVTLCGVRIPHTHGLIGHSDADIGWHALTDAILGAVALGDIGDHFPPTDPRWKDADSGQFLIYAQSLALQAGYQVSNVDITLICEAPKIKPHRLEMRQKTASLLDIPLDAVSVKATTTETLGFTGRCEGMAGQAAAVLTPMMKHE